MLPQIVRISSPVEPSQTDGDWLSPVHPNGKGSSLPAISVRLVQMSHDSFVAANDEFWEASGALSHAAAEASALAVQRRTEARRSKREAARRMRPSNAMVHAPLHGWRDGGAPGTRSFEELSKIRTAMMAPRPAYQPPIRGGDGHYSPVARLRHWLAVNIGVLLELFHKWDVDAEGLVSFDELHDAVGAMVLTEGDPIPGADAATVLRDALFEGGRSDAIHFPAVRAELARRYGDWRDHAGGGHGAGTDPAAAAPRSPVKLSMPARRTDVEYALMHRQAEEDSTLEARALLGGKSLEKLLSMLASDEGSRGTDGGEVVVSLEQLRRGLGALGVPITRRGLRSLCKGEATTLNKLEQQLRPSGSVKASSHHRPPPSPARTVGSQLSVRFEESQHGGSTVFSAPQRSPQRRGFPTKGIMSPEPSGLHKTRTEARLSLANEYLARHQ